MDLESVTTAQSSEVELKNREMDLKDRELRLKETELGSPNWRNPVFVGLMAAALGLFGNLIATSLQNWNTQRVERYKAQSNLILEAIKTGDQEKASKNLSFFLQLGFIDDDQGKIRDFLNKKTDVPVLPSGLGNPPPNPGLGNPPSSAMTIRVAKLALSALGLFKGRLDNEDTDAFRAAVMKFQAHRHIQPDGVLDTATAVALATVTLSGSIPCFSSVSAFATVARRRETISTMSSPKALQAAVSGPPFPAVLKIAPWRLR